MSRPTKSDQTLSVSGLNYHLNVWDGGGETTVLLLHGYLDMVGTVALADAALSRHLDWLGEQLAG